MEEDLEQIKKDIEELKTQVKPKGFSFQKYEDIKFYPNLKVDNLYVKYVSSATTDEPTAMSNSIMLWEDTTIGAYYFKSNFNGTPKKVGMGTLFGRYVSSTTGDEPTILKDEVVLWEDTLETKYYLKADFDGTPKKVELL